MSRVGRLMFAILGALVIQLAASNVTSASCAARIIVDQILRADVIASGVVTAASFDGNVVTFRPAIVYKGGLATGAVKVRTGPLNDASGLTFVHTSNDYRADPGTIHTLYLRREGNDFATDDCSGSHPGSASGLEIAALGPGRAMDSDSGPLTQFLDQLAAIPPLAYLALVVILVLIVLLLRSRRRPPLAPLSGAPA